MSEPKTPKSQEAKSVREIDEQTQKHIDRFLQGKEVWNKWANEMLAKKTELEEAGKWKVEQGVDGHGRLRTISAAPSSPEIQNWLDVAFVDFSNTLFQTEVSSDFKNVGEDKLKEENAQVKSITVSESKIDFSCSLFPSDVNFIGAEFQGGAYFSEAEFQGEAYFSAAEFQEVAYFDRTKFQGEAYFGRVEFQDMAYFGEVNFQEGAYFGRAEFQGLTSFAEAKFHGEAYFGEVNFQERSYFYGAKFQEETSFDEAKFQGRSYFDGTKFQGRVDFKLSDFEGGVDFSSAAFDEQTNFEAILVKRFFSLADAEFTSNIPNYTQANFAESPRLDNIEVLPAPSYKDSAYQMANSKIPLISSLKWQRYWWNLQFLCFIFRSILRLPNKIIHLIKNFCLKFCYGPLIYTPIKHLIASTHHGWNKFTNTSRDKNEEAHYRALKRLAIQAHDHENEMKFFAGEIRSRRHITDFFFPWKKGIASSARYWAGVAYELFSDFGRSFIRPIAYWGITFFIFANLTLSNAGLEDTTKCHNSQLTPKEAAYTIGLKNSLLILGLTKTNIVKQAELCLYGLNKNGTNKNGDAENKPKPYNPKIKRTYQTKSTKADTTKTDIPFKAAVQGITHSGLSLLFIFLLLLAIRNQFKIK